MSIHWKNLDTAGKVEAIRSIYVPGMTAKGIAVAIGGGVTRNAIIGLYTRNGPYLADCPLTGKPAGKSMSIPAQLARAKADRPTGAKIKRGKAVRGGTVSRARLRVVRTEPAIVCAEVEPPLNISLMDLERHHCRWPVTDDGPHLFCGRDRADGSSYCAGHRRLSVGNGTESERSADRTLLAAA